MYVEGEHVGFVGTLEDITAHKEAEAERERLLAREQAARKRAERATRLRDETLAVVAHDLRSPLQNIAVGVQALRAMGLTDDPRAARQLDVMRRAANRMARLIADLLDVSRMESGTFEVRQLPVEARSLLDEIVEVFDARAAEGGVALTCDASPDLPPMIGERERLTQALSNLVDNALRLTPAAGRVRLCAEQRDFHIQVSVEDTGPGIPPDILPHLFERFWQADRASPTGTGLGLAIAKGIVTVHRGHIWVEAGREARFCFTIPTGTETP